MASSISVWACLPKDLIDIVLDHIFEFHDFIRFCSVCKSWRSIALDSHNALRHQHHQKLHLLKTCRNQLPILLMKPQPSQENNKRLFFSVTQGTFYDIQLPIIPYSQRLIGSSHGWLFTIDDNSKIITLIQPFLNKTFSLPPFNVHGIVQRVKLLFDPNKNNYVVLMVYFGGLAFLKSKTQTWITISRPLNDRLHDLLYDIISYKGQIYSISLFGDCITVDLNRRSCTVVATVPVDMEHLHMDCLVESQEGDLLLVRRYLKFKPNKSKPNQRCIELYKGLHYKGCFDFVRMSSIGEQALFLDNNESISISTRDFPMCKPNCIYYDRGCIDISKLQHCTSFDDPDREEECFGSPYPLQFPLQAAFWVVPRFKT